jgi:hypothetical protein
MCSSNLEKKEEMDHVKWIAEFAIDAVQAALQTLIDVEDPSCGNVVI